MAAIIMKLGLLSGAALTLFSPVHAAATTGGRHSTCPHPNYPQCFDYVIVGGGTGGLVVANRLSANPHVTVAVIEAGTFPEDVHGNWTQVPFYQSKFVSEGGSMMWEFETTPQPGAGNVSVPYFRAKALGGCSAVNAMAYTHTCKGAHQTWADSVGDQAYTYDNMRQFYHKTMDFTPPVDQDRFPNVTSRYNKADTVRGGALAVTFANYVQSWATWFSLGLDAIGVKATDSFINGNLLGQAYNMDTINQTSTFRSSSQVAYLRPVLGRPNLFVFNGTFAQKIVFNHRKEATGVVVGAGCTISAKREVIVSAGFIQSPQLLLVSGVGPAKLLESLNIPVVADRPGVGQNMKEQFATFVSYQVNLLTGTELNISPPYLQNAVDQFNKNGSGPLSSPGGDLYSTEVIPAPLQSGWSAAVNKTLTQFPADWPHVGYAAFPSMGWGAPAIPVDPTGNYASVLVILQAVSSTGYVSISSANMSDPPIINPAILEDDADVALLLAALKRMRAAFASPKVTPILIGSEVLPGAAAQTDEELVAYLRKNTYCMSHGFATNKMGKASDPMAVVDNHGSVFGVKNLRVIDGSAFPFLPPGPSPQTQVYMLAEKLAQDVVNTIPGHY